LGYPQEPAPGWGEERVIDRVVETMKSIFDEVLIVVNDREHFIGAGVSVVRT